MLFKMAQATLAIWAATKQFRPNERTTNAIQMGQANGTIWDTNKEKQPKKVPIGIPLSELLVQRHSVIGNITPEQA